MKRLADLLRLSFLPTDARYVVVGALLGLLTALAALVDPFGVFELAELAAFNAQFAARGPREPETPIVIVAIDEDSFQELDLAWPFPRELHGKFLDAVGRGRPAAIGLDVLFVEPSVHGPADDAALAAAVRRVGRVVLAATFTSVGESFQQLDVTIDKTHIAAPLPEIRAGAAAWGYANPEVDRDAAVRRGTLTRPFQAGTVTAFDAHLVRLAHAAGLARRPLPTDPEVIINYRGGPGTFPWVSYHRVVNGDVPPSAFTGKIVLVGATTEALHDVFRSPFAPAGGMPGVEIHANVIETLLSAGPIHRAPAWIVPALTVAAGALAVWAGASLRLVPGAALVGGALGAFLVATHLAFVWGRLWVHAVPVPLSLSLWFVGTELRNFIREQRERRRLSRFFSPQVVREIVRGEDGDEALDSGRRVLTVLFSDIRGFTALSERMPPEEVAEFLREYLTEMTEAVFTHGGTVDKYIGDAVMALYNVPFESPDHAAQAVRTALEFQRRLRPLAERFTARHGGTLRCGVGIHTGEAVVGTLGSRQRLEYTAIGDTVNLGSRLEGLTKDYDVPIIISEATWSALGGRFVTRPLGETTVKGREEAVKIYAVLGEAGAEELPEGRRGEGAPPAGERRGSAASGGPGA